jgi:peptidyl-prolyl cis-trans isomerase SDCCAG10
VKILLRERNFDDKQLPPETIFIPSLRVLSIFSSLARNWKMSSVYQSEPPTTGKVVIHTSFGDLDVELWTKEAPYACRNFIQLSMEGYYDNTPIHRLMKDFMMQMGDPTGTGKGGESCWGRPFKDEFHGRLKFNHRGLVAMANENKPNSNHSQFFFTFDSCEWIDNKNTIFGRITGNTIFNLMRMNDAEVDDNDRPVDPLTIRSIKVLLNPFDDIVPRASAKTPVVNIAPATSSSRKRKSAKDAKLLSFGEEEGGDATIFIKKTHPRREDTLISSSHLNGSSSSGSSSSSSSRSSSDSSSRSHSGDHNDLGDSRSADAMGAVAIAVAIAGEGGKSSSSMEKRKPIDSSAEKAQGSGKDKSKKEKRKDKKERKEKERSLELTGESMAAMVEAAQSDAGVLTSNAVEQEFERLRAQLLRSRRTVAAVSGDAPPQQPSQDSKLSLIEQQRARFLQSGSSSSSSKSSSKSTSTSTSASNSGSKILGRPALKVKRAERSSGDSREAQTLARLAAFTCGLRKDKALAGSTLRDEPETYSGQVTERDWDEPIAADRVWHTGGLSFKRHIDDKHRK